MFRGKPSDRSEPVPFFNSLLSGDWECRVIIRTIRTTVRISSPVFVKGVQTHVLFLIRAIEACGRS